MTADRVTWEFPPRPTWAEALLGESVSRPEAEARRALGMPPADTDATLAAVDAAVEGRCAGPGCSAHLTEHSPSAYFCGPACQESWERRQAGRPSPGSAPVRGSEEVDPSHMRWRPDLVAAFDDSGLTLHWEQEYANGLASRTYQNADGRLFARLDDGNRWVGMWLSDDDTDTVEQADEMWGRLERELSDRRRLAPEFAPGTLPGIGVAPIMYVGGRAYYERDRSALIDWLGNNGLNSDDVPAGQTVSVDRGLLILDCYTRDAEGDIQLNESRDGPLVHRVSVPLVQPLPEPRSESHVCRWEVSFETGYYRCGLHWSDGSRCESRTDDPAPVRRTERLVGPRATGGTS